MTKVGIAIILSAPLSIIPVTETKLSAVSVCFEKQQHNMIKNTNNTTRITTPPATLPNLKQTKEKTSKLIVIPSIVMFIAPAEQNLQKSSIITLKSSENIAIPTTTPTK